jgi:hypothetical protein
MMRYWIGAVLFFGPLLCAVPAQPPPEPVVFPPGAVIRETAPSPLPHVSSAFEDAAFWTARHPEPDRILLTPEEIEKINRSALKSDPEAVDIFSLAEGMDSAFLKKSLSADQQRHGKKTFYDLTNRPLSPNDITRLFSRMNLEAVPPVLKPQHGLICRETNLRLFPTDDLIMDRPFDYAFDRFQSDRLESGTAATVLHYTADRTWCYVETGRARGWIRPNDVAIGTREEVLKFAAAEPLVVTGDSIPFFLDRDLGRFVFDLPMGARLPLAGREGNVLRVLLPWRDVRGNLIVIDGYVRSGADVHEGWLPYTMAAVIRQAFKLRESRYSWGGLHEGRDCSRFIMDVFRCFGFQMPRDSYRQAAFAGNRRLDAAKRTEKEKIALLERYRHTPTLLYMKGHIMLFLGVVDGRVYAIHSYWDYGPGDRPDIFYHVGRVTVSDLSIGKSGEGNLLRWMTALIPLH